MTYGIKEIFYTLQGEGFHSGRPAVFCRFSGCNLWSGREEDRATAQCRFCDTDFLGMNGVHGGKYHHADTLSAQIDALWPVEDRSHKMVVLTGGEPLLQVDEALVNALHARRFFIAVETNGTVPVPQGIDWVCVSPKAGTTLLVHQGDELKVVFPQMGQDLHILATYAFTHFSLQPLDDAAQPEHTRAAIDYCMAHPQWRLSLQTHKILQIP